VPRRPTGRAPGRPRNPVTPEGKVQRAREELPHARAFPFLCNAVDRSLAAPESVLCRDATSDPRNVAVSYRYTSNERGQILAFVWWVYANRNDWSRKQLKAAITSLSPLMLFSSTFLSEMTGIPTATVCKAMVRSPRMATSRVTGTCDVTVVHRLLETAAQGMAEYREAVRELSIAKGIPDAMLSRISGVPREILLRPNRGIDFFAEKPDLITGQICSVKQRNMYVSRNPQERRSYDAQPGNQHAVRSVFAGTQLGDIRTTHAPVPDEGQLPHHLSIPGLPLLREADSIGFEQLRLVQDWQVRYNFSASAAVRPLGPRQHP
jgi:hypothetical protein